MSDGCQANTSTFTRGKVTSALSYLGSRVAPMVKVPPVPSSLVGTFLVAGGAAVVFLCLPAGLDGASSTAAQRSEEARLPEGAPEHSPGVAFLPGELDGTSSTVAQHSKEARSPEWAPEHLPGLVFLPAGLDGSAALRRGALAGVGARALAGLGLLAGGARWHVLDGSAALRRGALAGVGARALAGLLLSPGSSSGKRTAGRCRCCVPV